MQLPWVNLPESNPMLTGLQAFQSMARAKQEKEQAAARNLLDKQRLAADEARMRAEEHRAAAQEERAKTAEKRNADAVERQQRLEAAQFIQQAPGMLDPKAAGYNPSLFQALGQVHGANFSLQQPNLPPMQNDPGAAPQEPQSPMVGPLETPDMAGARAAQESFQGQGPAQDASAQVMKAQQEAMKQQAERDQYQQALAAHPDLVKQHAEQVGQFKAYQAAKAQADANPVYSLHTPFGDSTLDFGQRHQAETESQRRQAEAAATGFGDTAGKAVGGAAGLGVTDPVALARIAQDEQRREADRQAAKDLAGAKGKNALEVAALRAAAKKKGGGGGEMAPGSKQYQAEESRLATELTNYEKQHKLTGKDSISEHQHELNAAVQMAEAPNQNGVTQLKIMDKMIRAATGLGVRNQTLDTYMKHMGGLAAQGENKLEQWATGAAGKQAWANVVASVRGDLAEAQKRGGEENKAYWDMVGSSPAMQRHQDLVKRRERGAFGGMAGYGGGEEKPANPLTATAAHPKSAPVGETKTTPDGQKWRKVGPDNWQPIND